MRIVFLGTPDFAVQSLKALISSSHEIVAVVTQPDKPAGRKSVLTPSPVKTTALENGLKVLQYEKISRDGVDDLKALAPDIMVTCAYGQILSRAVLEVAPKGVINVHASLLPKYRGAAPIQYAILNGERETGVTIMQTEEGLDSGDILAVSKVEIGEEETAGELFDRLSEIGAKLLIETLDRIEKGNITPIKQDDSQATYVRMIKKQNALIDWSRPAEELHNFVRGMDPWPVAFTYLNGKTLRIYKVEALKEELDGVPGEAVVCDKKLIVKCGKGLLKINELQIEGGKRMNAYDFLLGRRIALGDILNNG